MEKLRVGIWGIGRAGYGMHCAEIDLWNQEVEVVAACDLEQERLEALKKRYPSANTYLESRDFLADPAVELVAVAVRSTQHVDYAIRALQAGKYVFCEKPVAMSYAGAMLLQKTAEKYPGKLFFRHNRRFEAAFNHVQEIIQSGILGEVFEIKLARHDFSFRSDWQAIVECGGGQLNNWGPHLIDQALRFLESPLASLWSDLKTTTALGDAEDHVKVIMRGTNGRVVDFEISDGVALPGPVYAVYGTRGSLVCEDEQNIHLRYVDPACPMPRGNASASSATPPFSGSFHSMDDSLRWIQKTIPVKPANNRKVTDIYHDLAQAIRNGVPFPITTAEAIENVRVMEEIKKQNPQYKQKNDVFGCETF